MRMASVGDGATGSGKSITLAAIVNHINQNQHWGGHIIHFGRFNLISADEMRRKVSNLDGFEIKKA